MGRAKRQRKEWRAIDGQEVEEFLEQKTREERLGPSLDSVPDDDLFFVDTEPDDVSKKPVRMSKKEKFRNKLTRAQAIIQGAHVAEPVIPQTFAKKAKNHDLAKRLKKQKQKKKGDTGELVVREDTGKEVIVPPKEGRYDIFSKDTEEFRLRNKAIKAVQEWKKSLRDAPAVEIDASGCSVNPDYESHQEAVGQAVAAEMKKQYDAELLPVAPPKVVEWEDYEHKDELERLLVESDGEEEEEDSPSSSEDDQVVKRSSVTKRKKTIQDRNREMRNKLMQKEIELRKKEKKQRRELERLGELLKDVESLTKEQEEKLRRRHADLQELIDSAPPRLGKHKFNPFPIQVLTTDEIKESGGSLRKIKPTPVLIKERYKSLQRRGIIEPRVRVNKSGKKRKTVIHGKRADNAEERQQEIHKLRARNKKLKSKTS